MPYGDRIASVLGDLGFDYLSYSTNAAALLTSPSLRCKLPPQIRGERAIPAPESRQRTLGVTALRRCPLNLSCGHAPNPGPIRLGLTLANGSPPGRYVAAYLPGPCTTVGGCGSVHRRSPLSGNPLIRGLASPSPSWLPVRAVQCSARDRLDGVAPLDPAARCAGLPRHGPQSLQCRGTPLCDRDPHRHAGCSLRSA